MMVCDGGGGGRRGEGWLGSGWCLALGGPSGGWDTGGSPDWTLKAVGDTVGFPAEEPCAQICWGF